VLDAIFLVLVALLTIWLSGTLILRLTGPSDEQALSTLGDRHRYAGVIENKSEDEDFRPRDLGYGGGEGPGLNISH